MELLGLPVMFATLVLASASAAVTPAHPPRLHSARLAPSRACPSMNWFANAFANDDTLGARDNAGLTKEKTKRTITWKSSSGKTKQSTVVPGQKLRDVARAAGIPIKYSCNEGTCKTCQVKMGGGMVKVCVGKVPDKDVTIVYK